MNKILEKKCLNPTVTLMRVEAPLVARNLPEDRILIETDCPYMAPVPLRGRRNEPSFLPYTLAKVAELRGVAPDRMAQTLCDNACRALRIDA